MVIVLLSHGRVILLHPRIPACKNCNKPELVKAYEKYGSLYAKLTNFTTKIVLLKRVSDFEFICGKCIWCRPDPVLEHDGVTKLWYQSCDKCGERHITNELGKCAHCDLGLF